MAVTRHGENRYDAARRSRKQVPRPPDPGSPDPFTNAKEDGARNVDAPERSPSLAGEGAHQPPPRRNDPLMLPGIELDDDPLRFPRHRSPGERDPGNPFPWLELPGQEVEQRRFSRPQGPSRCTRKERPRGKSSSCSRRAVLSSSERMSR